MGAVLSGGCRSGSEDLGQKLNSGGSIAAVDLSVPSAPEVEPNGVSLSTARGSFASFALRLDCSQLPDHPQLRLNGIAGVNYSAYQVLPVHLELGDAASIRQSGRETGEQAIPQTVPRVLLPLPASDDVIDLSGLRDPQDPSVRSPHSGAVFIWVDLEITAQSVAGQYSVSCDLIDHGNSTAEGSVPVQLTVEDLTLPTERHLHFVAPLEWSSLLRWHPDQFATITPRLMFRQGLLTQQEPRFSAALSILDQYLRLAHDNGADLYVPRLQPIVKWPPGSLPEVDWSNFDSVTSDWLTGKAFADNSPVAFWPLPAPDSLTGFDFPPRLQYWQIAAGHFDQMQWLDRSPVVLGVQFDNASADHIAEATRGPDSIVLSAEAGQILSTNPRLSVMLGINDDQLQLASPGNVANHSGDASGDSSGDSGGEPAAISLETTSRLLTVSPGLIYGSPIRNWPAQALPPRHWIDATAQNSAMETPGQTTGLTSEQGIRSLAWLAFARNASLVMCGNPLPAESGLDANASASFALDRAPNATQNLTDPFIWCYPGAVFGVDHPLATIQLKWIRQAEQDYEYLMLASQKGDRDTALRMCRLITKPVELQPAQAVESIFDLLAGTTDPHASERARRLLVGRLLDPAGARAGSVAASPVALETMRWFTERQKPTLVATADQWMWNLNPGPAAKTDPGHWIDASINLDLYNPSDNMATGNQLEWTATSPGWEQHPSAVDLPALWQYQVRPCSATARFDLDKISAESRQPIELTFVDGFTGQTVPVKVVLPVAVSQRRQNALVLDGSLNDWFPEDAIQLEQPLVRMLNRPALQAQDLQLADPPASIFTSWSDDNFYLAFRLGGVATADLRSTRNFVQYDHGRAWGEDLCELLIQPIYPDNTAGPTLHVVCKPGGNWVEQQRSPGADWDPCESCGIRYASGLDTNEKIWRGELAIPWEAIVGKTIAATGKGRPNVLRFNFIQHQNATDQSASWAGPIDQSRDGKMAGLLILKDP